MQAIVCVDRNWGIGCGNRLLFRLHADLKRFRTLTVGKTIVMGHRTLQSLPGGRPLPDRRNIVLSHQSLSAEGVTFARSVAEAVSLAGDDAVVIGGASVYRAFLPYCDRVLVTKVDAAAQADAFFPDLDADAQWCAVPTGEVIEEDGVSYQYIDYIRR